MDALHNARPLCEHEAAAGINQTVTIAQQEELLNTPGSVATVDALLAAAEHYRAFGLKPIPLTDGKTPKGIVAWQERSFDQTVIERHLKSATVPGIGIQNGPASGIIDFEWDSPEQRERFFQLFGVAENVPKGPAFGRPDDPIREHRLFQFEEWMHELGAANLSIPCLDDDGQPIPEKQCKPLIVRVGVGPNPGSQSAFPPSPKKVWRPGLAIGECQLPHVTEVAKANLLQYAKKAKSKASPSVANAQPISADVDAHALGAMLRHEPMAEENDGSKRLLCVGCRAVEYGLSDESAVATIREYAKTHPFPSDYSNEEIVQRIRDAEKRDDVQRGAAWRRIDTSITDLAVITPLAWKALQFANAPPSLFRYGGIASRIESGDEGEPVVKGLDSNKMRHHLARAAEWVTWVKRGKEFVEKKIAPPQSVVNDVLATPDYPLPILSRIVEGPVFAADGTLQTTPGYHAASQTYYAPADGFSVPDVPEQPTAADIALAQSLICEELLGDFPFIGNAERAHAVALLLLPFARDLIVGPTPLHLLEKPSPGTGATLLVDMLSFPAIGRAIPAMTEGRDEDEWRKRITAKLRSGSPFVLIDNLRRRLDSAAVSAGITATTWEDRILGASDVARLPVRCVWMATGNNPAVSTEIARRTVRIRMDARMDRPWLRSGFRHPNLRQWAADNRAQLVWAALTLIRAWIVAGKPRGEAKLGMYERWSEVMGGILEVAKVPGFLTNLTEFYDETDAEGASWRAFIIAWWEKFKTAEKPVKDLWQIVSDEACLSLGDGGEQSQKVVLGKMLAERRDRVFELDGEPAKLMLRRGKKSQGAYRWHLAVPALAV